MNGKRNTIDWDGIDNLQGPGVEGMETTAMGTQPTIYPPSGVIELHPLNVRPDIMTEEKFAAVKGELDAEAYRIQRHKQPGYVGGDKDVLHNFKTTAKRLGITPMQAWGVHLLKHIDALTTMIGQPTLPVSEEPIGRFADALNYLQLGYALYFEQREAGYEKEAVDARSAYLRKSNELWGKQQQQSQQPEAG